MNPVKFETTKQGSFHTVLEQAKSALKEQGFGIITEINFKEVMKEKIGKDYPEFRVLGACNPRFADEAMAVNPDTALFVPCNVTVKETGDSVVTVSAVNPLSMLQSIYSPELEQLASDVANRLEKAVQSI